MQSGLILWESIGLGGFVSFFCFVLNISLMPSQVPIGSGLSDGLEYPINPRFDSEGRLRKRSQWPEGLR
jgi:hypothetical protein